MNLHADKTGMVNRCQNHLTVLATTTIANLILNKPHHPSTPSPQKVGVLKGDEC